MKLGIDFGTTHTVAVLADRGNYPVVGFDEGQFIPSLVAASRRDGRLVYGHAAGALVGDPDWEVLRSMKRLLNDAGPQTGVVLAGRFLLLADILANFLEHVREEVRSSLGRRRKGAMETVIGVPANAFGAQRFLTAEAFGRAGFEVAALLNEPSAAALEYVDRYPRTITGRREHILVYDLGGGTFDASVLRIGDEESEVLASAGIGRLGGDDFDETILGLVLDRLQLPELPAGVRRALLDECRRRKEFIEPTTRRVVIDLSHLELPPLTLPVETVYEACRPLVERTLAAIEELVGENGAVPWEEVAGVYVVGGASRFPLVHRTLRERFGEHRVRRSLHPFAATAIGLAIFGQEGGERRVADRLTRHFGVWREAEEGRGISFDVIFTRGTLLPGPGDPPLEAMRSYRAAHDLGYFRFVECGGIKNGNPSGEVLPWKEIVFPFVAQRRDGEPAVAEGVRRLDGAWPLVTERYRCSAAGLVEVTLTTPEDGYSGTFQVSPR